MLRHRTSGHQATIADLVVVSFAGERCWSLDHEQGDDGSADAAAQSVGEGIGGEGRHRDCEQGRGGHDDDDDDDDDDPFMMHRCEG